MEKRKLGATTAEAAENLITSEWSPDGRYFMTATAALKRKTDAGIKIFDHYGLLCYEKTFDKLYQADWKPESPEKFGEIVPLSKNAAAIGEEITGAMAKYYIMNYEGYIGHGFMVKFDVKVPVSYLTFKDHSMACELFQNLSRFNHDCIIKPYDIIVKDDRCWLVVEKISCSLKILFKNNAMWIESRLNPVLQKAIRDIILGISHIESAHVFVKSLTADQIVMVNNRSKMIFIGGEKDSALNMMRTVNFTKFYDLLEALLPVEGVNMEELEHFLSCATLSRGRSPDLEKLYYHPMLMTLSERFILPLLTYTRTRLWGSDDVSRKLNFGLSHQNLSGWLEWEGDVPTQGRYRDVFNHKDFRYSTTYWSRFVFTRNVCAHINDNLAENGTPLEPEKVAQDLAKFFPDHLNVIYDFFGADELKPF